MANPNPEIMPDLAKEAGARVVGTGRSDFPNQVNNVLAFPGIFRGALDVRATHINEKMKVAAVEAIAGLIHEDELKCGLCYSGHLLIPVLLQLLRRSSKSCNGNRCCPYKSDPEEIKEKTNRLAMIGKSE